MKGKDSAPFDATVGGEVSSSETIRIVLADVLRLVALGHTNSEIAEQLYLSVRTVETHRSHIQQKLRLSTRAELVGYAVERGLIKT
jgi:DNA-binding CsgD family transcriptional regulator